MSLPITTTEALDVRVEDVAPDGSAVSIQGEWFGIATDAGPLLRAALIEHTNSGRLASAPLLNRPNGLPRTDQWLLSVVTAAAAEAGVRVLSDQLRLRPSLDERWLIERGVSLHWLDRQARLGPSETPVDVDHRGRHLRALGSMSRRRAWHFGAIGLAGHRMQDVEVMARLAGVGEVDNPSCEILTHRVAPGRTSGGLRARQ